MDKYTVYKAMGDTTELVADLFTIDEYVKVMSTFRETESYNKAKSVVYSQINDVIEQLRHIRYEYDIDTDDIIEKLKDIRRMVREDVDIRDIINAVDSVIDMWMNKIREVATTYELLE